jgi:2-dehydropantoate 2-reductase
MASMFMKGSLLIVGGGAIGTLFAIDAVKKCVPTYLLVRDAKLFPAVFSIVNEDFSTQQIRVLDEQDLVKHQLQTAFPVILFACKHYDLRSSSAKLKALGMQTKLCITLSNGLDCAEQIIEGGIPCQQVCHGVTYAGAAMTGYGTVIRNGNGQTFMEQPMLNGSTLDVLDLVCEAIPNLQLVSKDALASMIWKKLLANVCINPLSAILNVPNGKLPMLAGNVINALANEFMEVCPVEITLDAPSATDFVLTVCQLTSNNTSSMLADVLNGKRTEIESLTGALIQHGNAMNKPLVTHRIMFELIKALEAKKHFV